MRKYSRLLIFLPARGPDRFRRDAGRSFHHQSDSVEAGIRDAYQQHEPGIPIFEFYQDQHGA